MKYDIYVINLDRNKDRRKRCEVQFKTQNLTFVRFPAFDGKTLEKSPEKALVHPNALLSARRGYRISHDEHNYGSIGCYLSHLGVWKVQSNCVSEQSRKSSNLVTNSV
jgi:GR25 family glycosyltransferase involved in LPS biosynthesis